MKKIVFLHVSSILGGSERSFLDLVEKATPEERKQFHVLVPQDGPLLGELKKRTPEISVSFEPLPVLFQKGSRKFPLITLLMTLLSLPSLLFYLLKLKRKIRQFKPDLIYTNGLKCHLLGLVLIKGSSTPLIWHLQDYFPDLKYVRLFLKWIGSQPRIIICNSESVQAALKKTIPPEWTPLLPTVHNSVDLKQFSPDQHKNQSNPPVISMVGMITPWKGQDVFIEAISWLVQNNPQLPFHAQIVGGEVYSTQGEMGFRKQLEAKVQSLKLNKKISFLGMVQDVESIYKNSDIVTHCSKKPEPFGRVIIEAMSSGCTVVATRGGGVDEIVVNGQNGYLVTPSSAEELGQVLQKLILNPELRTHLSQAGRKTVEQKFSADSFSTTIFSFLEKVSP